MVCSLHGVRVVYDGMGISRIVSERALALSLYIRVYPGDCFMDSGLYGTIRSPAFMPVENEYRLLLSYSRAEMYHQT